MIIKNVFKKLYKIQILILKSYFSCLLTPLLEYLLQGHNEKCLFDLFFM